MNDLCFVVLSFFCLFIFFFFMLSFVEVVSVFFLGV